MKSLFLAFVAIGASSLSFAGISGASTYLATGAFHVNALQPFYLPNYDYFQTDSSSVATSVGDPSHTTNYPNAWSLNTFVSLNKIEAFGPTVATVSGTSLSSASMIKNSANDPALDGFVTTYISYTFNSDSSGVFTYDINSTTSGDSTYEISVNGTTLYSSESISRTGSVNFVAGPNTVVFSSYTDATGNSNVTSTGNFDYKFSAVVPEPASMITLASGLVALASRRKKRA